MLYSDDGMYHGKKMTILISIFVFRLQVLKDAMIGGERANDKELSERRKRKKMASEKRLT